MSKNKPWSKDAEKGGDKKGAGASSNAAANAAAKEEEDESGYRLAKSEFVKGLRAADKQFYGNTKPIYRLHLKEIYSQITLFCVEKTFGFTRKDCLRKESQLGQQKQCTICKKNCSQHSVYPFLLTRKTEKKHCSTWVKVYLICTSQQIIVEAENFQTYVDGVTKGHSQHITYKSAYEACETPFRNPYYVVSSLSVARHYTRR